jgi:hypothetical protein
MRPARILRIGTVRRWNAKSDLAMAGRVLGAMGAVDVKLMAAVGGIVGLPGGCPFCRHSCCSGLPWDWLF